MFKFPKNYPKVSKDIENMEYPVFQYLNKLEGNSGHMICMDSVQNPKLLVLIHQQHTLI